MWKCRQDNQPCFLPLQECLASLRGMVITQWQQIDFSCMAGGIEKLPKSSPIWRIHWTMMACLSWSLWRERNNRAKQNKYATKEVVLSQCLDLVDFGFKATKFKKYHISR